MTGVSRRLSLVRLSDPFPAPRAILFWTKRLLLMPAIALVASTAFSQTIPQSTLFGKVTVQEVGTPGITVTIKSPNLQGSRTTTTTAAGDYIFPLLPPGDYTVTF